MKVLVVNAGSSSLKYQIIDMATETMLCKGLVERIGIDGSNLAHQTVGKEKLVIRKEIKNHTDALQTVIEALTDKQYGAIVDIKEINAVGHRVLHAGEDFKDSVVVDDAVLRTCKKNEVLGPLHMPANIACIESCMKVMPGIPMVAVFDTGFHQTMPKYAYMYAIPYDDYEKYKIRKYGFHGTSHKFVSGELSKYIGNCGKVITCHLGNGSSIAAVKDGKCIDTTMGLTPLEGLVMGTRSGDLDPAVVEFMSKCKGIDASEVLTILNKKSGFLGLAGSGDFRDVEKFAEVDGNEKAKLAVDMFAYRIRKYIGSYYVALGGLDCIIFTGGIGENSDYGREKIMQGLECLGVDFDFEKNKNMRRGEVTILSKPESKVKVIVIPTNEELVIARDAVRLTTK